MADASSTASSTVSNVQTPIDALTASIDALDTPSSSTVSSPPAAAPDGYDPVVRIILREDDVEPELRQGCQELCKHAVRGNLEWVRSGSGPKRAARNEYCWFVHITRGLGTEAGDVGDPPLTEKGFTVRPSHSDFTDLPSSYLAPSGLPSSHFSLSIRYRRRSEAYRALGHIISQTRHCSTLIGDPQDPARDADASVDPDLARFEWTGDTAGLQRSEDCLFETLGIMIDCSRNGVLLVERVEEILRFLALTGCNMLQLYTEDTYEASCRRRERCPDRAHDKIVETDPR